MSLTAQGCNRDAGPQAIFAPWALQSCWCRLPAAGLGTASCHTAKERSSQRPLSLGLSVKAVGLKTLEVINYFLVSEEEEAAAPQRSPYVYDAQ